MHWVIICIWTPQSSLQSKFGHKLHMCPFCYGFFFAITHIQIAPKFDHKLDLGSFGIALIQIAPKFGHKLDLSLFGDNLD
jgi:uncharacterized membrane protein